MTSGVRGALWIAAVAPARRSAGDGPPWPTRLATRKATTSRSRRVGAVSRTSCPCATGWSFALAAAAGCR
eukprot:9434238-Lingulodinium_polyedra.AAC.1